VNRRWKGIVLLSSGLLLAACVQVVQQQAPPEIKVKTPDPFFAAEDPALEPTDQPDWLAAPSLDVSCYFYKQDKTWYRFYRNRWFQAFRWDGAWFELPESEVPAFLQAQAEQKPIVQKSKSKMERLKELERRYEELEQQEAEREEGATPSDEADAPMPK